MMCFDELFFDVFLDVIFFSFKQCLSAPGLRCFVEFVMVPGAGALLPSQAASFPGFFRFQGIALW